jgi:hypothetical protein
MIVIAKWSGLVTNASPYAIPPGAMVRQVNLQCVSPGVLECRPGTAAVTFSATDITTNPVRTAFRYQFGGKPTVVYQDSQGRIFSSDVNGT